MFLRKLQQFGFAFLLALMLPARTVSASTDDRVQVYVDKYLETGDLEALCFAYFENRKILSLNPDDPQGNLREASFRIEGLNYDFDSIGGFSSPQVNELIGDCPVSNFNDIAPHPSTIVPDTYYNQPIRYYLEQTLKGGIDHPEFFILYARFLLDINDAAKAIEITELGIKKAPKGSSAADSVAELYFQNGIANTRLMEQATQSMSSSRTPLVNIPLIGNIGGLRRNSVDDVTYYYRKAKQATEQSLKLREHSEVRELLRELEQRAQVLGIS